jgi:hypothetical protein
MTERSDREKRKAEPSVAPRAKPFLSPRGTKARGIWRLMEGILLCAVMSKSRGTIQQLRRYLAPLEMTEIVRIGEENGRI